MDAKKAQFDVYQLGEVVLKNDEGQTWCGPNDGWVHEESDHFSLVPDCQPFRFESLKAAVAFAKEMGML